MKLESIKKILFILLMGLLFFPFIQSKLKVFTPEKLSGAYNLPDTVGLTFDNWNSGEYQTKFTPYYEYKIGFRPLFVRLRNQIAYSLFNKSTSYVVIGKDDNLYAWDHFAYYSGEIGPNKKAIEDTVLYLDIIRTELQKRNIELLVLLAPNKVRCNPNILNPKDDTVAISNETVYNEYKNNLSNYPIHVIDYNKWFSELSPKSKHPLFPNTGIHWSTYGASIAADSMLSYVQYLLKKDIVKRPISGYEKHSNSDISETDLYEDLNLLVSTNPKDLVYPIIDENKINQKRHQPKVWIISDSFYWNWYGLNIQGSNFHPESEFWFYNNTAYGNGFTQKPTKELNKPDHLNGKEIVILMATESNLYQFPYGFISNFKTSMDLEQKFIDRKLQQKRNSLIKLEKTLLANVKMDDNMDSISFKSKIKRTVNLSNYINEKEELISNYCHKIYGTPSWIKKIKEDNNDGMPLDQFVRQNATYVFHINDKNRLSLEHNENFTAVVNHYENIIKDNTWFNKIKTEAKEKSLPLSYVLIGHIDYLIYMDKNNNN